MLKKRKVDPRLLAQVTLSKITRKITGKTRASSQRCSECGVCPHCADSLYKQYGYIVRAVAGQVRMHNHGEPLDTAKWISLFEGGLTTPRRKTLYKPYLEDAALILTAARKYAHPLMYFEYAMNVIATPGFNLEQEITKLLPWNLVDYYFDYVPHSKYLDHVPHRQE
jgi:hypothetical protein